MITHEYSEVPVKNGTFSIVEVGAANLLLD